MPINIEEYLQKFNALSDREKMMVVGAFLIIVWALWDNLFYQSIHKENLAIESEIVAMQTQLGSQQQLALQVETIGKNNPNASTQQQLTNLLQSVSNLKERFTEGDKKFVPTQQMANALSDMLKQQGNLKVIKLETLPVSTFGNTDMQSAWMYRHALAITLQGDYFSTLNYLKKLETLPWRILWDNIDYQVKEYPIAETRIQVYTLSFEQDWLGV
jgi:MSHA biogenesis protein MshJ